MYGSPRLDRRQGRLCQWSPQPASGLREGGSGRRDVTMRVLVLVGVAALSCAACAPVSLLTYRDDQPPTVSLPVALAGVQDERRAFGALFEQELKAERPRADDLAQTWLRGIGAEGLPRVEGESRLLTAFADHAPSTSVLIVPGLFGDCFRAQSVPFGDGVLRTSERSPTEAYRQYDDLALRSVRMVALPGRASSADNGGQLAQAIRAEAASSDVRRIVLIAYSKGVADSLSALAILQREGGIPASVAALVSVAGVVMGTPFADYVQDAYETVSPMVAPLDCSPARPGDVASVTRHERVAWLADHPPAPGIAYYSVVAYAAPDEMAPPLRVVAEQLAAIDPRNDGQLIASDTILPGSVLLAEARADHWDIALPRNRHPSILVRELTSGRDFPREALFRAIVKWVVGASP